MNHGVSACAAHAAAQRPQTAAEGVQPSVSVSVGREGRVQSGAEIGKLGQEHRGGGEGEESRRRGRATSGTRGDSAAAADAVLLRTSSAKMQLLAKLLPKLRARGHRVLLFCQMTRMLDVLEDWLRFSGVGLSSVEGGGGGGRGFDSKLNYGRIDGTTPSSKRQRLIESFNAPDSRTLLWRRCPRARGGLGLNLATADTIILYDPDFNPFVDQQAQARAHRMGQRREVAVYQLVTWGTVEERIVELARGKLAIEQTRRRREIVQAARRRRRRRRREHPRCAADAHQGNPRRPPVPPSSPRFPTHGAKGVCVRDERRA